MRELEIVTAAVVAGEPRGARPGKPGEGPKHANLHAECLNCGVTLHGRYCSNCGQTDDDHHRSIFALLWEVVEDATHLDGRLAKTLPALFIRPGQLVRDHFEGRRQRHVPPLRLFLVTLLLFMLSLEFTTNSKPGKSDVGQIKLGTPAAPAVPKPPQPFGKPAPAPASPAAAVASPAAKPAAKPAAPARPSVLFNAPGVSINTSDKKQDPDPDTTITFGGASVMVTPGKTDQSFDGAEATKGFDNMAKSDKPILRWFAERGRRALASKGYFRQTMFEWGHRLAIVLLPIFAGFLTLFYFYKKKYFIYDHLVTAMHFLSFTFLLWGLVYLIPEPVAGYAMLAATIWTPINLFLLLRGAYGSSIAGAVVKALSLWVATLCSFVALLMGVVLLALGSI